MSETQTLLEESRWKTSRLRGIAWLTILVPTLGLIRIEGSRSAPLAKSPSQLPSTTDIIQIESCFLKLTNRFLVNPPIHLLENKRQLLHIALAPMVTLRRLSRGKRRQLLWFSLTSSSISSVTRRIVLNTLKRRTSPDSAPSNYIMWISGSLTAHAISRKETLPRISTF